MKKQIWWLVVIVIILFVVVFVSRNTSQANEIKIGLISPLTGQSAVYGEPSRNAAVLAAEEINQKGGILGKKVNLVIEDGKCDGTTTASATHKLIDIDHVSVILGGHCSTESLTIAPISQQAKVITVALIPILVPLIIGLVPLASPLLFFKGVRVTVKDIAKSIENLIEENSQLTKQVESFYREKAKGLKTELASKSKKHNGVNFICEKISLDSAEAIKDIAFELKQKENTFLVLGAEVSGKPSITVAISDDLVTSKKLNAGNIVRELAKEIKGGGGGQPNYANAGGSDVNGIKAALEKASTYLQ